MNLNCRSLLKSSRNTRDLGGYKIVPENRLTHMDKIWRSDVIEKLDENDRELLLAKDFTTMIDLRTDAEVKRKPSQFSNDSKINYYHFPIEEGSGVPESLEAVPYSYMKIAQSDNMRNIFECIARVDGGVLFHCTAGKDRTGVVSAILLLLVGVAEDDIVFDYVISREYNKVRLEKYLEEHPEVDRDIVLANEKSMIIFLKLFREKYGTAERYLANIGVGAELVNELKKKL